MGTSISQRSPRTIKWKPTDATLGSHAVPVERQSTELWRAALSDREGKLANELSSALVTRAMSLAESTSSPIDAQERFDEALQRSRDTSLVSALARRALVRAVATQSGASGFAQELLAETVDYFAARDLPSLAGSVGRLVTSTASIELKRELRKLAKQKVQDVIGVVRPDDSSWPTQLRTLLSRLTGTGS